MQKNQNVALTFAIYNGRDFMRRQTLSQEIVRLGSGAKANVRIQHESVARMHAVVEAQDTDEVTLIDLGNEPQSAVNGVAVNKCALTAGDEISLGDIRIVVETIEHAAASRVASARPLDIAKINPFLTSSTFNPFKSDKVAEDAPEGTYEYRMVGATTASPDVESDADGAEVKISWGTNLLHIEHIDANAAFFAGETTDKALKCNYFIPAAKLGTSRAPLVLDGAAVLLPGAAATVSVDGKPAMSMDEAIAAGLATPCDAVAGAYKVALRNGMTVKLQLEDVFVEVRGTKKARKVATAFTMAAIAGGALLYILGSFFGHAGLLAAMAAFVPPLGATADDDMTDEQRYLVKQYLDAAAETVKKEAPKEQLTDHTDGNPGGRGTAAKGESGKMGDETSTNTDGRYAIQGHNPDPYIAKQEALRDAAEFGMIGLINTGMGSKDEPIADWGALTSDGMDPLSADGNIWGSRVGAAYGPGGLGLTGVGEGGDGLGEGIGLGGGVRTIGHGAGYGCYDCQGFGPGNSDGFLRRGHKSRTPITRMAPPKLNGRLPPEAIQRVVRANFGRFRACYQSALSSNPNLQGRVAVNFVIGRSGTVSSANAGGDLPNQAVKNCVAGAFQGLTFPQPEHGIVTVTYPIVFSPAQ